MTASVLIEALSPDRRILSSFRWAKAFKPEAPAKEVPGFPSLALQASMGPYSIKRVESSGRRTTTALRN